MTPRNTSNAMKNINDARDNLLQHFSGYFWLADNEFLSQWLVDDTRYSAGRQIKADLRKFEPSNRRSTFASWAKFILRHIYFSFNLSLNQVGALWVSFHLLSMKREIPNRSFLSDTPIWYNVMSLWPVDNQIQTQRFERKMRKKRNTGSR